MSDKIPQNIRFNMKTGLNSSWNQKICKIFFLKINTITK